MSTSSSWGFLRRDEIFSRLPSSRPSVSFQCLSLAKSRHSQLTQEPEPCSLQGSGRPATQKIAGLG